MSREVQALQQRVRQLEREAAVRRRASYDRDRPEPLSLGRSPRRVSALSFAMGIPGFLARFDGKVPAAMYDAPGDVATVACPCGGSHEAPVGEVAQAECGRWFVFTGSQVLVARTET